MRNAPIIKAERHRVRAGELASTTEYGNNGAFLVPAPSGRETLLVIASDGDGWDHVSVSAYGRCPTWEEMCSVKRLFFRDDECVVQYHPPEADYVNNHPHCLHLWRPQAADVPRPPSILVGVKDLETKEAMPC